MASIIKKLAKCTRCGGAGGSNHWPGFTCYRCHGEGTDPTMTVEQIVATETKRTQDNINFHEQERARHEAIRASFNANRVKLNPELAGIEKEENLWSGLAKELFYRAEMKKLSARQIKVITDEVEKWNKLRKDLGIL